MVGKALQTSTATAFSKYSAELNQIQTNYERQKVCFTTTKITTSALLRRVVPPSLPPSLPSPEPSPGAGRLCRESLSP